MKLKLIWRQLLLVLVVLLGFSYVHVQVGHAAGSGVTGAATYKKETGIRLVAPEWNSINRYIAFTSVTANNIQGDRLTKYTDRIYVKVDPDYKTLEAKGFNFDKAYLDVVDANGKSVMSSSPVQATISSGTSATFSTTKQTLSVNLSKLGTTQLKLPIYVGVRFSSTTPNNDGSTLWMVYGFGMFEQNDDVVNNMKDVTIQDPVQSLNQKITGTAEPNSYVSTELNGTIYDTTADASGNYTITLPLPLSLLGDPDSVTVSESNDMGDMKSATATVHKSMPVLSSTSSGVTITPALLETLSSDDDVLAWLVKAAGITVQDSVSHEIDTRPKYSSTDSNLAQKLTDLATGDSTNIDVGATSNDVKAPTDLSIKVTKTAGELKFTTVSDALSYGNLTVPSTTTLFAPVSAPDIQISDTRTAGSPWHIAATAGTLTDGAGHDFSGQLMYVDGNGQSQYLATASTVASGMRAKGVTTVKTTDGWENQKEQPSGIGKPGIYLQAKPNIYTGGNQASYSGDINWQLVAAP
ncbi:hypothetical protein ACFP1L_09785 [Lactiplantibacillus nangangensis]|uniref:Cell surface protein n=1 Tax=Lactiplantibacillus nangangensis TaxID=2559917 RepID=A0ABW1SLL2_9LACO|nr:hypothetical protein [Lactiplantibacillus nangangensis]